MPGFRFSRFWISENCKFVDADDTSFKNFISDEFSDENWFSALRQLQLFAAIAKMPRQHYYSFKIP